jgi:hypothetical protein
MVNVTVTVMIMVTVMVMVTVTDDSLKYQSVIPGIPTVTGAVAYLNKLSVTVTVTVAPTTCNVTVN